MDLNLQPKPKTCKTIKLKEDMIDLVEKRLDALKTSIISDIEFMFAEYSKREKKTVKTIEKISKFCMEDYSYIQIIDIIKNNSTMEDVMIEVVKQLYFNKNKKENNIIKLLKEDDKKAISILKMNSDNKLEWTDFDFEASVEKIIRRCNDVMQHYIVGVEESDEKMFQDEIGPVKYEEIQLFTDKIDNLEDYDDFKESLVNLVENAILEFQA